MPDADCVSIRNYVTAHPGHKIGFVVFRLTYKDDDKWARFMERLNIITKDRLERYGDGDLFPHIDWSVQDDPSLEGLDHEEVRKRFRRIVEQEAAEHDPDATWVAYPRHRACVAVDEDNLESVMKDVDQVQPPTEWGSVWLLSVNETEHVGGSDDEDGDTLVEVSAIFPRIYSLLELGWQSILCE